MVDIDDAHAGPWVIPLDGMVAKIRVDADIGGGGCGCHRSVLDERWSKGQGIPNALIQKLLGALEFQPESLQPEMLLERVYSPFQPIVSRQGVKLVLEATNGTPQILVDEGRMVQVLKNLLENALRHTPAGGTISLGVKVDQQVQLWVKDSGEGIDAEDLPHVFERFYRSDKARGGNSGKMGLGLAICKALINAQGGLITAESPGKGLGTTMLIRLDPLPQPRLYKRKGKRMDENDHPPRKSLTPAGYMLYWGTVYILRVIIRTAFRWSMVHPRKMMASDRPLEKR